MHLSLSVDLYTESFLLNISCLFLTTAVVNMVNVAEILKKDGLVSEKSARGWDPKLCWCLRNIGSVGSQAFLKLLISCHCLCRAELQTSLDAFTDDGQQRPIQKPKMEVRHQAADPSFSTACHSHSTSLNGSFVWPSGDHCEDCKLPSDCGRAGSIRRSGGRGLGKPTDQ